MKANIGYFKQCMILYIVVPERVEAIVHKIANHLRKEKKNSEKDQLNTQSLSFSPNRP
jgi:hypothetical protein